MRACAAPASDGATSAPDGRVHTPCGRVTLVNMSPYYTFRSFAIYLAVSIIISDSPVSAFTIRRTRTTTLKSAFDLTGQESALLEVKNDLPKINNSKGNISQKETSPSDTSKALVKEAPTRTSGNALDVEKKSTQSMDMSNNEVLRAINVNKEVETTPQLTSPDDIISTIGDEKRNSSNSDSVTELTDFSTSEISTTNYQEPSEKITIPNAITTGQNTVDATQSREASVEDITEINSKTLSATEASSLIAGTETISKNIQSLGINEHSTEPVTLPDTIVTEIQSTYGTEKELITEGNSKETETMMVEASSTVTKNPSWKTYTTIERKRTTSSEPDSNSTEKSEFLTNAETMPTKITLENAANYTPITSLNELRQELINNSMTYNSRSTAEALTSLPNEPPTITTPALVSELLPTSNSHAGPDNIVTSKRAGFLDLTAKQSDSNNITRITTTTDSFNLNETELIGSLFEVDLQENDNSETKNETVSQSQMEEDAIREKLLEEQVLNDNMVKNYQRELKSSEVTDGIIVTDDSLSVKPINPKNTIYTISPQYKKMKKIEVQPLKPFIRDPDDNSWRNESLSLLGIVFKAKNASKPFTQVLKNKTEAELNNISERDDKNEVTDLRVRLGKIAEVRKSRKKKINKSGETVYSDYEESTSSEASTTPKTETTLSLFDANGKLAFVAQTTPLSSTSSESTTNTPGVYMYKEVLTTKKPEKVNKFSEYYDTTDEYDADYITLPKLDLKKFTTSFYNKVTASTPPMPMVLTTHARPLTTYWPDRKPTVQYFPPRTNHPKFTSDYDSGFQKKVNMFAYDDVPKVVTRVTPGTTPTTPRTQPPPPVLPVKQVNKTADLYKNFYVTVPPPRANEPGNRYTGAGEPGNRYAGADDETFNRASYVIKHYKDLIDEAVKDDYDKNGEYVQTYTDAPLTGVTVNEMAKGKLKMNMDDDYDYVSSFRKDILNKFVDTFNQNSERFKVDFPILYNSSVVHRSAGDGRGAISRAALRRGLGRPCEPHCELRVELSPAYELHYYVPDQEERETAEPRPPAPYAYRL